jgi:SAM-dependent methyltransferase
MSESRFDRTAELYADAAKAKDWSRFVEWCRPQPGWRALDVGAGPAVLSGALVGLVAEAVALDPSQALLGHAPAGVRTVLGSAEAMPFADGEFDLVTIVNSLHHVADPARTLDEMARVLAPAGVIVVQDYLADPDPERAERWETIERLRDPDHRSLPHEGEVAAKLKPRGLVMDAEMRWDSTWQVDAWLAMSATPAADADRIRQLIGSDSFALTAWRGRFVRAVGRLPG